MVIVAFTVLTKQNRLLPKCFFEMFLVFESKTPGNTYLLAWRSLAESLARCCRVEDSGSQPWLYVSITGVFKKLMPGSNPHEF